MEDKRKVSFEEGELLGYFKKKMKFYFIKPSNLK